MTPERLEELRRIAQMAKKVVISVQKGHDCSAEEANAVALHIATFDPTTVLDLLDEIERLRRERDAALDVLGREDIGDGAKVEGVRLILSGVRRDD